MERHSIKFFRTNNIIQGIKNLTSKKGSSETQKTSNNHEKDILNILNQNKIERFELYKDQKKNSESFRNTFQKLTGKQFGKIDFESSYKLIKEVDLNRLCLQENKTYSIHQPNGSQRYPDIVLFKIFNSNLNLIYLECKGKKPSFNNTPPKKNPNCIYICGNELFNGYYLRSSKNIEKYNDFQNEYRKLIEKINNDSDYDMVHIQYKKTEFGSKDKSWPPKYFLNKKKYSDSLNYFSIYNLM